MKLVDRAFFTGDKLRLFASLFFNFLAKIPGILSVFVILPMISGALSPKAYGELLSALAVGAVFALPFGGVNAVGRRGLAAAVGSADNEGQSTAFMSTVFFALVVGVIAAVAISVFVGPSWSRTVFLLVSLIPIVRAFLNTFDNMRASYNEHYGTAMYQLVFQILVYSTVFFVGIPDGSVFLSGLVLQLAYPLASIFTCITLLWYRPYLLRGRIEGLGRMCVPVLGVVLADGALLALLNLSVYWIKTIGDAEMAAWVGTYARLFQSFLSPVLLVLFPISSYISIKWNSMTIERRRIVHNLFLAIGLLYGTAVGVAMFFVGPLYIDTMFNLSVHGDFYDVVAMSVFMGAIIMQKAYSLLMYAVSEAKSISYGTAGVALVGLIIALFFSGQLSSLKVLDVLFVSVGIILPVMMLMIHFFRGKQIVAADVAR